MEGGERVDIVGFVESFLISVFAGVVASFIYEAVRKWVNGRKK